MAELLIRRFEYTPRIVKPMTSTQMVARSRVLDKIDNGTYRTVHVKTCICSADRFKVLARRDRYGMPVQTQICESCGTLLQNPRFTPESLTQFYQEDYRDLYMSVQTPETLFMGGVNYGTQLLNWCTRNNVLEPGATILDVGCGGGGALLPFHEAGYEVVGCDYDVKYLNHGRDMGLNLVEGGLDDIASQYENYFDLIILQHVLEHAFDPVSLEVVSFV